MHVQLGDRIYCSHDPLEVSSCSAGELTLRRCEASEDALEVLERLVEDADSESPAAMAQSEDDSAAAVASEVDRDESESPAVVFALEALRGNIEHHMRVPASSAFSFSSSSSSFSSSSAYFTRTGAAMRCRPKHWGRPVSGCPKRYTRAREC